MNNTIEYYNKNAKEYFKNTINGNMELSYNKFIKHIPNGGYILDFGCGSGRDSKYFLEHGYKIKAIDGSKKLCKIAEEYIKQKVEQMYFMDLKDINLYDGIWCCASLLHISKEELINVLDKIIIALKNNGVIYISVKEGIGEEIIQERYFKYYTKKEFINIIKLFKNLEILEIYDTKSTTNINEEKNWNNYIIKKLSRKN